MNEDTTIPRISINFSLIQNNLTNYKNALTAWVTIATPYQHNPSVKAQDDQIKAFLSTAAISIAQMQAIMNGLE